MNKYAIILAGGEGRRAGGDIPKQLRVIDGMPMVWWSMHAFVACCPDIQIIAVVHPGLIYDWRLMWQTLPADKYIAHEVCCGGRTRSESVKNGLMMIPDGDVLVAVHDAARPLVRGAFIERCFNEGGRHGAVVPGVPVTDSIRRVLSNTMSEPLDRSALRAVQTPQVFKGEIIKNAYSKVDALQIFTDDASLVQDAGYDVRLIEGEADNIKVTLPVDFVIAEAILSSRSNIQKTE